MDKAIGFKKVSVGTLMEDAEVGVIHFTPRGEAFMVNSSKGKRASVNRSYYLSGPSMIYIDDTGFAAASFTITNYDSFENYSIQVSNGNVTRNGNLISIANITDPGTLKLTINGEVSEIEVMAGNILLTNTEIQKLSGTAASLSVNGGLGAVIKSGFDNRAFSEIGVKSISALLWNESNQSYQVEDTLVSTTYKGTPPRTTTSYGENIDVSYDESWMVTTDTAVEGVIFNRRNVNDWSVFYGVFSKIVADEVQMQNFNPNASPLQPTSGIYPYQYGSSISGNDSLSKIACTMGGLIDVATSATTIKKGLEILNRDGTSITRGPHLYSSNPIHYNTGNKLLTAMAKDSSRVFLFNIDGDSVSAGDGLGNITVWENTGSEWVESFAPDNPNPTMKGFGLASAMSHNGELIAISQYDKTKALGIPGRVHIFLRNVSGWDLMATIMPPNLEAGDVGYLFGASLSVTKDGSKLIIGFPEGVRNGVACGRVFAYRLYNGVWSLETEIFTNDVTAGDGFGSSVAIAGSGRRVLVGASNKTTTLSKQGAIYVFK